MVPRLLGRGLLSGAIAGLLAFAFARIFAESQIEKAINYESGRDAAQALLDKAAGLPVEPAGPDIFSRTLQANLGIGVGMIAFGAAMGALFAIAYAICLGRVGNLKPRSISLLVAAGGFLAFYLVPFIKYPANPPSIGHPDTIKQRTALYMVMVVCAIVFLIAAVLLGKKLKARFGNWNASLLAGAAFIVAIGVVMACLPGLPCRRAVELPVLLGRRSADPLDDDRARLRPAGRATAPARGANRQFGPDDRPRLSGGRLRRSLGPRPRLHVA
jgi:hypothetical protein